MTVQLTEKEIAALMVQVDAVGQQAARLRKALTTIQTKLARLVEQQAVIQRIINNGPAHVH